MSDEKSHESAGGETLDGEGFSNTEDALKGADVESGTGQHATTASPRT